MKRYELLLACVAALFVFAAPRDDKETKAIAEVQRALHEPHDSATAVALAVEKLSSFDSPAISELLARTYVELETLAAAIDKQARAEVEGGKASQGEVAARRKALDPLRNAQQAVLTRVAGLRSEAALTWLLDHVLNDDHYALALKLESIRAAATAGKSLLEPFGRALQKANKPDDVMAMLTGLQTFGAAAKDVADKIVPLVDHADATVREAAAAALAKMAVPQAIEPLIKRLEKESGRTQVRIAAALEQLTRQKFGLGVDAWKSWFAAEGVRYASGQAPLGGGEVTVVAKADGYFHGIPQDSHSIVYVIDVSGSMVVSMTNPQWSGQPDQSRPIPPPAGEESRLECSKKELIKALGSLPNGTKFDVITFATSAERYSPRMVEASEASIKKAQAFVAGLQANGATNIYDAVTSAFALAGRGPIDKYYDSAVDTVFLLTDGVPTIGPNKDSTQRIEQAVKALNPFKRVVVHTIGLGKGIDVEFLKRLAKDNGGVFVQR
jgi:HEAT repeat protein